MWWSDVKPHTSAVTASDMEYVAVHPARPTAADSGGVA